MLPRITPMPLAVARRLARITPRTRALTAAGFAAMLPNPLPGNALRVVTRGRNIPSFSKQSVGWS